MSTWYAGPEAGMTDLSAPDPGLSANLVRYGGIHQGLSGARQMDITGFRWKFELSWSYMEPAEWAFLDTMYQRVIPGPLYLRNPLRTNLLSQRATALDPRKTTWPGVTLLGSSVAAASTSWPTSDFPFRGQSLKWTNPPPSSAELRLDAGSRIARVGTESLTFSVYVRPEPSPLAARLFCLPYSNGGLVSRFDGPTINLSAGFQRLTFTPPLLSSHSSVVFGIELMSPANSDQLFVAAPQVESGSAATGWTPGGGNVLVHLDQLQTTSPRFPLSHVGATFLEA